MGICFLRAPMYSALRQMAGCSKVRPLPPPEPRPSSEYESARTMLWLTRFRFPGFSCCPYRTFVTWKLVLGQPRLAEGLRTRWRPLYDHYGPVSGQASSAAPRCAVARTPNNPCYREATTPTRQSGCKTRCESDYAATTLRCQFKQECVLPRHGRRVRAMKVGGHQLVGIAVTVFTVPADFEGGLDAMI